MTRDDHDLVLADVRLAGMAVDIGLRDGRIARIAASGTLGGRAVEPGGGRLVLPGLVDGHIHLDKTFLGLPWQPHRPDDSVAGRIALEKAQLAAIAEPMALRARRLVDHVAARGTTMLRSHVDVDRDGGLAGLVALLELREAVAHLVGIQIVAFPQCGVLAHAEVLAAAVAAGADVVGGLDPAGIDEDIEAQLAIVFGIAERHGVPVDIHLHDPGELGAFELRRIAARTRAAGMQGRVVVSHAFALGQVEDRTLGRTAAALAEADVAIMTNGPGPEAMPPVKRLVAEGVSVFVGSDNIRDAWSPYGDGDMLARARLVGYRAGLLTDAELHLALDLVTSAPARAMGLPRPMLAEGAAADLVLVAATQVPEAIATAPPRALVVKAGRIVARAGALVG
ncbi:amidohydrolase [Falsiroseomonas selenitidurans]|uniref:Amidohydrolase family protein n=1 Tax=Falsiroseomonas selenitidurans TaxID=2716335 RepID=A0ABX1E667_9PROT|nr:amidohydrolase [Falsiroseomonas selenitidurans]NKC32672.1 amidohydrolase family protein [Falsiroseomonas selenitidurans]